MFTIYNLKAVTTVSVLSAAVLSSSNLLAQTSPETATALTSPTVSGNWSSNRKQEFYYSFIANSGQLQVTLDNISNAGGCQTVWIDIFDSEKRDWRNERQRYGNLFKLACVTRGTPKIQNITIPERRPLLMKVMIENHSDRLLSGNYTITLGGIFEVQPRLQQIDPKLLRERTLFERYPLPTPAVTPQ
ncbi:hypothetical protein [Fortiea contorta]|uniref:hypothetical protein n=1 Tax=Fortiea contorta TaxID=1892405 RepID=UPI00034740C0|nr:hypothetical protein [Fortiea contorta]